MKPKLDIGLFDDLAEFPCFYEVLAWADHKIVLHIKPKQFYDQVMQELRKNREIQLNQQTIGWQVLADLIKIWSCLIFIKLYTRILYYRIRNSRMYHIKLRYMIQKSMIPLVFRVILLFLFFENVLKIFRQFLPF